MGAFVLRSLDWFFKNVLGRLAEILRFLTLCAFPIGAVAVLELGLMAPQGQDLLRITLENASDHSGDITCLFIAAIMLALAVWYCARWLLTGNFWTLPLGIGPRHWARRLVPRLLGTLVFVIIAIAFFRVRDRDDLSQWLPIVFGFLILAGVFGWATWRRGAVLARLGWAEGRDPAHGFAPAADQKMNQKLPRLTFRIMLGSIGLSFIVMALFLLFPVGGPRLPGSPALLPLALACITVFGSLVLTLVPLRRGLRALAPALLVWAVICGAVNDNHRVRLARDVALPEQLPDDPREAVEGRWMRWHGEPASDRSKPYVVVATEGGGIRAAFWTAAVLEQIEQQLPGFAGHIFALSGVSGGSLGSAAWVSSLVSASDAGTQPSCKATELLRADFLSPALGGLLFGDFAQRFLPFSVGVLDRARGIEQGWQDAFAACAGAPMAARLEDLFRSRPDLPSLLLNTTVVETGQRAVQTNLRMPFDDTVDLLDPRFSSAYQPLAGLVHNSARFPLISPAGTVMEAVLENDGDRVVSKWEPRYRVVDGGYFDNSGATSAYDLIREISAVHKLRLTKKVPSPTPRPVLVIIRNDYEAPPVGSEDACHTEPELKRPAPSRILPELSSIVGGLYNARSAHARLAAITAARGTSGIPGGHVVELALCLEKGEVEPPLGWALSGDSIKTMLAAAERVVAQKKTALQLAVLNPNPAQPDL